MLRCLAAVQGLDIYLSRLAAEAHEEIATHCGRGPSFPASLMLEPRLHSQVLSWTCISCLAGCRSYH